MQVDRSALPLRKDSLIETRPLQIEEWLAALPYADFDYTSQLLHEALLATSQAELKPGVRAELLGLYRQPYQYYLNSQIKSGARHTLQSVQRLQRQLQGMKRLAADLALNARLVVNETAAPKAGRNQARPGIGAAAQAIGYLSQALIFTYLEYGPTPRHVWKQLNALYRFAESLEQQNTRLELPDDGTTTVARSYCRIALIAAMDPYHLPFGAVWEIYEQLDEWTQYAVLQPFTVVNEAHAKLVVDLDSDEPPRHYTGFDVLSAGDGHRLLDASRVQAQAQQCLEQLNAGSQTQLQLSPTLAPLMLTQMTRVWGLPPKRFFPREDINGEAAIGCGMNPVHFHLNNGRDYLQALPAEPQADTDGLAVGDGPRTQFSETASNYSIDEWHLVNRSPAGYALRKQAQPVYTVRVGDLIGLRVKAEQPPQWRLGTIRWLKVFAGPDYHIGIQLFAGRITPLALQALSGSPEERKPRRAFQVDNETDTTLITIAGLYRPGRELELIAADSHERVYMADLIEATPSYEQFTIQRP